jgi:hypothetical protein
VQILNSYRTTNKIFGSIGYGDGQFTNPMEICIDTEGNHLMAYSSNTRMVPFFDKIEDRLILEYFSRKQIEVGCRNLDLY